MHSKVFQYFLKCNIQLSEVLQTDYTSIRHLSIWRPFYQWSPLQRAIHWSSPATTLSNGTRTDTGEPPAIQLVDTKKKKLGSVVLLTLIQAASGMDVWRLIKTFKNLQNQRRYLDFTNDLTTFIHGSIKPQRWSLEMDPVRKHLWGSGWFLITCAELD